MALSRFPTVKRRHVHAVNPNPLPHGATVERAVLCGTHGRQKPGAVVLPHFARASGDAHSWIGVPPIEDRTRPMGTPACHAQAAEVAVVW